MTRSAAVAAADFEEAEVDAGASAGDIAVAVAQQDIDQEGQDDNDVAAQLRSLNTGMKHLNSIAEKQLRAATAGLLVHASENQFSVTVTAEWFGSPHDFATNPTRRTWAPSDPLCLRPAGMSDAEYSRLFPGHKALLLGMDVMLSESTMPFKVGVLSSCNKLPATATAGTRQKYHFIVRANATPTGHKTTLSFGSNQLAQSKFLQRYPGWTPDRIRAEGHMQDKGNSEVMWLGSHHPAQEWVTATLRSMGDAGNKQAYADLKSVMDRTATDDFVPLPIAFCKDCVEQCASDVDKWMPIVDLTELPVLSIQRPGLKFNEPTEMQVRSPDSLHALLRMAMPMLGTAGGFTSDSQLNGQRLLSGSAVTAAGMNGGAKKVGAAAASLVVEDGVGAQRQNTLQQVLNTEYGLTVDITYTFSSPHGTVKSKMAL